METIRIRHGRSAEEQRQAALDPGENIDNPILYLHPLKRLLASPSRLLALNNQQLAIDEIGILRCQMDVSSTDSLRLQEISVGEQRSRVLSMVRYPIPRGHLEEFKVP